MKLKEVKQRSDLTPDSCISLLYFVFKDALHCFFALVLLILDVLLKAPTTSTSIPQQLRQYNLKSVFKDLHLKKEQSEGRPWTPLH